MIKWIKKDLLTNFIFLQFICLNISFIGFFVLKNFIHIDESEHLHCAWLISQGLIPFEDFWQHHSPLLWVLLAPLIGLLKPTAAVFGYSKVFCCIIFILSSWLGWKIAKSIWGDKANLLLYVLLISSIFMEGEYFLLRPDLLMVVFLLMGVRFSLMCLEGGRLSFFCAGISFSLAFSFICKQYFLILLPLGVLVFCIDKDRFVYLLKMHILKDFLFWVIEFNSKRVLLNASFPWFILCLGVGALLFSIKRYLWSRHKGTLIIIMAFALSFLSSLTIATKNL